MKLQNTDIDFLNNRKSISKKEGKINSNEKVIKAKYNQENNTFYCSINGKKYNLKLINVIIQYFFSTTNNESYKIWTCKQAFKKHNTNIYKTSIYWNLFYDGMPIKGEINEKTNTFIIDTVYYLNQCKKYYENQK